MRNKKQRAKISARILAVLLCVCLAAQNVPMNAFAAETAQGQTQERSAGEFTSELSSEPFSESAEEATEEQAEETVQETVPEKIEEEEQDSTERVNSDSATETIEQTSEHESYRISEEASIAEESICEESATDNESSSETDSITEEWSQTEIDNFSGETVSRIEWLRELTSAFELNLEKENYPDNYYSDISTSSEYYHDIMVATGYGLVDVDAGEEFRPDDNATREFAAYSMNMRVGYVRESSEYTFSEAGEVTHADDIQAAIDNGWMVLDGSDFHPNAALTVEVKDAMIKEAKEIYASRKIDANHENRYEFTDNVIVIPNDTLIELSAENELTITDCPKTINQGDMFAVFDSGMPLVFRAEKISKSGSQTIVTIGDVDMEDAFTTFDMEGTIDTDLTSVFVEDDDETVQLNYIVGGSAEKQYEDGTKYESLEELGNREISAVQVVQEFDYEEVNNGKWFGKPGGNYEESNPACKFTITQTISDLDVNYISNGTSSVYLTVTGNVSINCSLNLDLLDAFMPDLKVIKIQVTPLAVTLDLDAVVTLKGKAVFNYDGFFEIGVDFKHNRGFKLVSHLYGDTFSTEINAEATVGLRASINANYVFIKGSLYAEMGLKGGVTVLNKDDNGEPKECTTIYAYLYANYGWSVKVFVLFDKDKKWSDSHAIYTKYNSPFRVSKHYENGKKVDCCTRSRKSLQEYKAGPMWFYSTPSNSKYGYNGGSSGLDADGNPFTIFEYSLNEDNEATITKYNGNVSALRIPEELDGYKVVGIGNSVFKGKTALRTVVVPDSVETIGYSAFENCSNLVSVQLPKGVTSIGYYAFRNCSKLKKVEIPKSLETTTANFYLTNSGIFYDCENLKTIKFEEGITKIPQCIFANCSGIESIEIPDTVISIEAYAFYNCASIKNIQISNAVTSIEAYAFSKCNELSQIEIPNSVTNIAECAFSSCGKLSNIKLSKGLKIIGYYAFRDCNGIKEIEIPKSLETTTADFYLTNSGIFYDCENLKTIKFEEGITKIPQCIFANCSGIEDVEIPDTVTSIEAYAFYNCKSLKNIILKIGIETIGGYTFTNDSALLGISIPDTVTSMGNYIFSGCTSLKTARLPNTRVNITDGMFQNCTSLTTIALPKTVTTIKQYAFQNAGLTELTLPENVTTIEQSAFDNCTALAKVTLNQKLKTIGNYAFRNNDALSEITIPNSVTTIGDYAFQDSDALTTATISDSVTAIGQYIFAHCDTLKDIKLGTGLTKIPSYAFNLCPELQKIVLPYRITTVDANAFTNCTKLTEVTIPRGTTTISANAFSYPDRLTIYGISGTYAEIYANQIGAKFVNREVNATNVTLSSTTLSMIAGAKHTLVMSVTPNDFTDEVVWKSSDTNILTVDNMGVITAKAVGTANVRVAVGEKTASCAVTVVQPVTSISLNRSTLSLDAFEDYTLTASVYPDNAADKSVEWTTSDEKIAIVSQTGKVTPLSKGTADITVTAKDGSGRTAKCTVTVTSEGQLCTQYSQLESAHNYANNTNKVWKYTYSGAKTLEVTFDSKTNVDDGYDFIYIYDKDNKEIKKATGTQLAGKTIQTTGDTVKIKLVSDEAVTAWGFRVTKISADGTAIDPGEENPGETETSTEGSTEGSSEEENSSEEHSTETEPDEPDGSLKDGLYITGLKTKTYTGSAVKQNLKVYYNKNLLQEGKDYTLSYKNNKTAGTALVMIKTKGNLTGVVTKTFQIQPRKINDTNVIIEDAVYSYDKKAHKKAPAVMYNGKKLKEGKDYQAVEYGTGDYTSVGTYRVKIKGIGNYAGTYDSAKVIIVDKDKNLSKAKVAKVPAQEYQNGAAVELPDSLVKVELNKTTLKKGSDYTVSYANNTEAGKAILIIKGKGQYAGTKTITFTIKRTPTVLTDSMVTNKKEIGTVEIHKNGAKPKPKLATGGSALTEGKDYAISYKNNKKAGTGTIVIKGKGNYTGNLEIPFRITVKDLTSPNITVRVPNVPYTGKPNKYQSALVLTDSDGGILAKNKDYTVEAYYMGKTVLDKKSNPKEGAEITVIIKGKGNYTGTIETSYSVKGIDFSKADIKVTAKRYTGSSVIIKSDDIISANIKTGKTKTALKFGTDYEIAAYSNNLKKGTATVTFKGIGAYAGEKTVKFKINSAQVQ